MTDQPAAWYPDPKGEAAQRYWDGSAWTDHVDGPAPEGFPPPPPPGVGRPPPVGGYAHAVHVYPRDSRAGLALGLSIVSIVVCGPLSIAGILLGQADLEAIDRGETDPSKRGLARAAFVVGIVAAVSWVIGVVVLVGFGSVSL